MVQKEGENMRKNKESFIGVLILVITLVLSGCASYTSNSEDNKEINNSVKLTNNGAFGEFALSKVKHIENNFLNRLPFTQDELNTALWIKETVLQMGSSQEHVQLQNFKMPERTPLFPVDIIRYSRQDRGVYEGLELIETSQNVIVTIPGQVEQTIIIGAHYDTNLQNSGTSDNASGMGLLLENIYRMKESNPYYTLKYIFFGAEEIGLVGSQYFVENLSEHGRDNLIFMINADVLFDGPDLVFATGKLDIPLAHYVFGIDQIQSHPISAQIQELANSLNDAYNLELISEPRGIMAATDQLAFIDLEIPVMLLMGVSLNEGQINDYRELITGDVMNTYNDTWSHIKSLDSNRKERAIYTFSKLLYHVLNTQFN